MSIGACGVRPQALFFRVAQVRHAARRGTCAEHVWVDPSMASNPKKLLLTLVLTTLVGCATGPDKADAPVEREIPPEVTDRTTQPYLDDEPAVRPYLDVLIEQVSGAVFPVDGAAALVEREGLRCYRLGRNQQEDLEGTIIYEVMVTTNGRVAGVDLMSASFRNERVESCLERILYRLRFDIAAQNAPLFSRLYVRVGMAIEELGLPDEPDVGDG